MHLLDGSSFTSPVDRERMFIFSAKLGDLCSAFIGGDGDIDLRWAFEMRSD